MKRYFKNFYLPVVLGASIEHYDTALYAFMAPVLVQVFFPHLDKTTAYFFYFLFECFAAIARLIGASFFGAIGDKYGRKPAMYGSTLGISCVTFTICLLPTYKQLGMVATILFMVMRALQSFFSGGEYNGGAIYCLEHEQNKRKHGLVSGIYCAFTVMGIIAASIISAICNKMGPEYFRIAYALSFILALFTYKTRTVLKETSAYLKCNKKDISPIHSFKRRYILSIAIASLFFGVIYGLPTRIFNVLLPIAIGVHSDQIIILNIASLILYMGLLILSGFLSEKYGAKTMMRMVAVITSIVAYPLMVLIQSGCWLHIISVKIIFTMLCSAFVGPFHAWAQQLSPPNTRYKSISTSYAIGKCFSTILLSCSFLLYEHFQNITILGIILSLMAIITISSFYERDTKEAFETLPRD